MFFDDDWDSYYLSEPSSKPSSDSDPDSFYERNKGEYIDAVKYRDYTGPTKHSKDIKLLVQQFSTFTSKEDFHHSVAYVLTLASIDIAPPDASEVVVFVVNHRNKLRHVSLRVYGRRSKRESKPELVAFLVPQADVAKFLQSIRDKEPIRIPTTYELVAAARVKLGRIRSSQCMRHLFLLSRHRPASSLQYGIIANTTCFWLLAVGLDAQIQWPVLRWVGDDNEVSDANIHKLYACVEHIQNDAMRNLRPEHPAVPKLFYTKEKALAAIAVDSAEVGKKRFNLLPIFTSKGNGRKPFIAVAAVEGNPNDLRIFKYSWNEPILYLRERGFLERLRGAPGVVRIDDELCVNSIQEDCATECVSSSENYATEIRTRSLLALRTVGHPLSSCSSVLEFLEAMYDLLEVIRYLVQEEGVLHRDVSWGNVLIRPQFGDDVRGKTVSECPADGIRHHYRFISDIHGEEKLKVRVALADFDHAFDLRDEKDELKGVVGTPMFMANDVLDPRPINHAYIKYGISPFQDAQVVSAAQAVVDLKNHTVGAPMPMADNALSPRPVHHASVERSPHDLPCVTDAAQATTSNNQQYHDANEREFWDDFYRNKLMDLKWVDTSGFTHGAVHDAESVFWICLLFFNRMWPRGKPITESELYTLKEVRGAAFARLAAKSVDDPDFVAFHSRLPPDGFDETFYDMLKAIHGYLSQPWYNVTSTGRGEAYEFHLHDFMQRLFLKEIIKLRSKDIPLDERPFPIVSMRLHSGFPFTSCYKLLTTGGTNPAKRGIDELEDPEPDPQSKRQKGADNPSDQTTIPVLNADPAVRPESPGYQSESSEPIELMKPTLSPEKFFSTRDDGNFAQEAWDLLHEKKAEVLWIKCDRASY